MMSIPDYRSVLYVVGMLLVLLAAIMCVPAAVDLFTDNTEWHNFLLSAFVSLFIGTLCALSGRQKYFIIGIREAFLITTIAWLAMSLFAALPFYLRGGMSLTNAVFESVSGLTTTGSTILTGLDRMPPGILLWRSLLQWIGGVGIVVMAIMILPILKIGGMQLFRTESSEQGGEKVVSRQLHLTLYIGGVYAGLTAACAIAYLLAGMTVFDAVNHAMTTLATGGYSTHDASFGYYKGTPVHVVGTVFMALGSLPFVLYIKSLKGNWGALWQDEQVRGFVKLITFASLGMIGWLCVVDGISVLKSIEMAVFNVVSVVTTTGFASADYGTWGAFPLGIFLLLTFLGGCTGSTSGAIKVFRFQVLYLMMRRQIKLLTFPRGVFPSRYNGAVLSEDIVPSVIAFFTAFLVTVGLLTLSLSFLNLDLITSFSGAVTAVANVGPGLGPIIGPSGNFSTLPDAAKWLLCLGMLLGRLEIFTILVVFTPAFWRG